MIQKNNKINIIFKNLGKISNIGIYSIFGSKHPESLCFVYILSGKWFFNINTVHYSAKSGDILIFQPGDIVSAVKSADNNKIFIIEVTGGFKIAEKFDWTDYYSFSLSSYKLSDNKNVIKMKLKNVLRSFENSEYLRAFGEFLNVLSVCMQYSEKSNNDYVKQIINYIKTHHREHITTSDIAAHLNISESYCCLLFKEKTGETIINYINKLKIELAKKHIIDNDIPLRNIAEAVGFSNYEYFARVFKKYVHITPSEYIYKYGAASI